MKGKRSHELQDFLILFFIVVAFFFFLKKCVIRWIKPAVWLFVTLLSLENLDVSVRDIERNDCIFQGGKCNLT